ncbi:hypothetical protein [Streptomyces swartbergensis]|uniref:hypothetical protein n=1 Tax=Streptomyces swartbergensis TaxID=487165 RepID=UPI0026A00C62
MYKVAGKVLLIVTDDSDEQIITVKCEPEHAPAPVRGYASITPGRYLDQPRRFRRREQMTDQTAADFLGALTTRPPLDPELAPVEEALGAAFPPVSDETLPEIRRQVTEGLPGMEPEDLTAGGRVRVEERQVPGPEGAPDITLLILSPFEDRGPKGASSTSTVAG